LDDQRLGVHVDVLLVQVEGLTDAQPAPPQERDESAVANARRSATGTSSEKKFDLLMGKEICVKTLPCGGFVSQWMDSSSNWTCLCLSSMHASHSQ
jgi:hypothetical protein